MPLKTQIEEMPNLNMTSMIDIVFLLIIFFMVGTKFAENERKIALEVPRVSDRGTLTSAPDHAWSMSIATAKSCSTARGSRSPN